MKKTITYVYRGQIERGTGEPGYRWHDGYSQDSADGLPLYPWMTRRECQADAKAQCAVAQFYTPPGPGARRFEPSLVLVLLVALLSGCAARRPAYAGRLIEDADSDDLAEDSPTASDLRTAVHDALDELHVQHARWDGKRFICPSGTALWASEPEALDGRSDYVYCVKR